MAKPELGTKRVCPTTGRKFYDLGKDPIISPYTGMVVPVAPVVASRGTRAEAKAVAPDVADEKPVADEEEVELVSLEEADEDETATGKKETADDDLEIEEIPDADGDDDTFLEEDEDANVDAAELIDGDVGDDEET